MEEKYVITNKSFMYLTSDNVFHGDIESALMFETGEMASYYIETSNLKERPLYIIKVIPAIIKKYNIRTLIDVIK